MYHYMRIKQQTKKGENMKKIALFSLIAAVAGVSAANADWRELIGKAPVDSSWRELIGKAPIDSDWRELIATNPEAAKPAAPVAVETLENNGGFVPAAEPVVEEETVATEVVAE